MKRERVVPIFGLVPGQPWGTWSDPSVLLIGTDAPYQVLAAHSPAGLALATEAIEDALAFGVARRVTP